MSHPNKVSVIFKKKDKEDTTGYLRLSYIQDNKTKLISIKMLPAIPENYWNAKKERIKSGWVRKRFITKRSWRVFLKYFTENDLSLITNFSSEHNAANFF